MSTTKVPTRYGGGSTHTHGGPDGSRLVQFYGEDNSLLDSLTRFIGGAVMAGDAAVVVCSRKRRDALAGRLKASGLDLARATRDGRYMALDGAESLSAFMDGARPDPVRFMELAEGVLARAASKTGAVAIFGEMVAMLWAEGNAEAAIELEELWNGLSKTHTFSLLCAYPLAGFNRSEHEESFQRICATHTDVIPMEEYTSLENEEGRRLHIVRLQQKAQALETERTEREKAQRAVQSRDAELADLLENALEGVQQTGANQRILWANSALLKLLGYSEDEYLGHYLSEFYVDEEIFEEFWTKVMRREEIYDFAADLKCKDESVKQVVIHSNGLWQDGELMHTRTFIRDITASRQMERALRSAHEELESRVNERTQELNGKSEQILRQSEALNLTNQSLRELSARLMQVQDEERRRIARDLHDSTGQSLALLSMNLSVLETEAGRLNPDLAKGLSENAAIVREVVEELRTLSYLLHPPLLEEMGLQTALRWLIEGFGKRSGIAVNFEEHGTDRLPRDLEIAIFRAAQECLTNIHRHSESATADVSLYEADGNVVLKIRDQGRGVSPDVLAKITSTGASGVGLRGMRERIKDFGGELSVLSQGSGTEVEIRVPIARGKTAIAGE